jgi:tetratricopeptide (TPR) repeat protein
VTERHETGSIKKGRPVDIGRLHGDVAWALEKGLGPRDLVPMLERLRRHAPPGSSSACFAGTELAELLLPTDPWRAAVLARQVLVHQETDRAWALLGLALSVLGHYSSAKRAFAKALRLSPACSSYAHNLGHLLDAGLDRPREALRWLEQAVRARPFDAEIAASYAHALVRVGRAPEARQALERAMGEIPGAVDSLLARWASKAPSGG